MKIQDRIKELRRVKSADLRPNPKNWRTHPESQADAMRGILSEIGYAAALIARELPDGSLMLLDGHLRAEIAPDQVLPVLVLDVTEEEGDKLLLSLDPLAAMAELNAEAMAALTANAETSSAALQAMWDKMDEGSKIPEFEPVGIEQQGRLDEKAKTTCPECGHEF